MNPPRQGREKGRRAVADITKNAFETLRVEPQTYKGRRYVSARVFVPAKDDAATLIPTKQGFALTPDVAREAGKAMLAAADQIEPKGADDD